MLCFRGSCRVLRDDTSVHCRSSYFLNCILLGSVDVSLLKTAFLFGRPLLTGSVYEWIRGANAMSKEQLHAFIDRARADENFRSQLATLDPQQIIDFAAQNGFDFSDEIKGRFINRWKGVYFCPQAIEVGQLCPGLVPEGYKNLIHYAQTTCSSSTLKEEENDFRSGQRY